MLEVEIPLRFILSMMLSISSAHDPQSRASNLIHAGIMIILRCRPSSRQATNPLTGHQASSCNQMITRLLQYNKVSRRAPCKSLDPMSDIHRCTCSIFHCTMRVSHNQSASNNFRATLTVCLFVCVFKHSIVSLVSCWSSLT